MKQIDLGVKKGPVYLREEETLTLEQKKLFEELVSDYQFAAVKAHGWKISSPAVLAELIRLGWRKTNQTRMARAPL